jgi:hypothetical protein
LSWPLLAPSRYSHDPALPWSGRFLRSRSGICKPLGIHPNAQRRGVGGALLAAGLAIVDADHVACQLHTSDKANMEYYKRWGFELTQPGFPAGPGGPTYYGMTRPAA